MVLPRLRSMQTFSKFALIYESINQLVDTSWVVFLFCSYFCSLFFAYYWLTFVFRLVVCCLFLSVLQIFPRISFCCVLLCTLREPPYALNFWSSFNLSKMILIPSFFLEWGGGWGGREGGKEYIILFRHYYSILDAHSINIRKTNKVLRLEKDDTGFTFLPSTLLRPWWILRVGKSKISSAIWC